jgi:hypothetical protein
MRKSKDIQRGGEIDTFTEDSMNESLIQNFSLRKRTTAGD